jgi:hypothetical protein
MANWQDQIGPYQVTNDGEEAKIQQIIRQYPFLVQVLREAFDRIQVYFPDSQVFLHTTSDPEVTGTRSEEETIQRWAKMRN